MNKKLGTLVLVCSIASTMTQGVSTVAFAADSNTITTSKLETKDGQTDQYKYSIFNNELTITKYLGNEKDIEIPDEINGVKVVAIAQEAFKDNEALESVTVPEGVRSILLAAFNGCSNLKKVVLPEKVDYISDCAFMNCKNLQEITMPKEAKGIGNSLFCNCTKLTEIDIPSGVTLIGMDFANGCSALTKVTIPDTITTILSGSFQGCTSLREITIPSSVNRIEAPFQDLKHIIVKGEKGSEAEKYATRANFEFSDINGTVKDDTLDKENASEEFKYIVNAKEAEILSYVGDKEDVVIPDTIEDVKVTSIGSNAFKDNSTIKSVKLPESIEIINSSAFENCSSLETINIPDSITKIKDSTFKGCISLNDIKLNEKIEAIEYNAFNGCSSLKTIDIPASVGMIDYNVFDNCSSLEEINVSKNSTHYSSRDGILYSAQGSYNKKDQNGEVVDEISYINLLKCPGGYKNSTVKIANDVNYIRFGAFNDAKNVKTLEFDGEKINLISVTDLITEKVKEEDLTSIKLTLDTLEKVSKAAKSKESFSITIGSNNEAIIDDNKILPNENDEDKEIEDKEIEDKDIEDKDVEDKDVEDLDNEDLGEEIANQDNEDKVTSKEDKETSKIDSTGNTADLSSPLSLTFIMSLMGATVLKMFKTKKN